MDDNATRSLAGGVASNKKYVIIILAALALANIIPNLGSQHLKLNQYLRTDDNKEVQQSNRRRDEEASLIAIGDGKRRAFPSWAVVTQCSLYHTDCPNHLEFQDYPFPLPLATQSQQDDEGMAALANKTNCWESHLSGL
mmetsp:Transcript_11421/g.19439  ORF Transcript_11421/g.19439 Transcript_11421/m.19439 type:complete len:139 (-) Transcript_11421:139-555(-)